MNRREFVRGLAIGAPSLLVPSRFARASAQQMIAGLGGAPAGPALVSQTSAWNGSWTCPAMACTTGNLLVVCIAGADKGTGVTDTAGNTYTALTLYPAGAGSSYARWFYCLAATGHAANVIDGSVSVSNGFGTGIQAFQYSGLTALDAATGVNGSGTSIVSPAFTTTVAGLILTVSGSGDTAATNSTYITPTATHTLYAAFAWVTNAAVVSQTITCSGAGSQGNRSIAVVAFKP